MTLEVVMLIPADSSRVTFSTICTIYHTTTLLSEDSPNMIRFWPLLFIIVPLLELYLIIKVGGMIGAFMTVLLVVTTAVVGVSLLRFQGFSTIQRAQANMARGQMPAMEMFEGMLLAIAGVLLLTPGFLTDSIGFFLLLPAGRRALIRAMSANATFYTSGFGGGSAGRSGDAHPGGNTWEGESQRQHEGRTIEGDYERKD